MSEGADKDTGKEAGKAGKPKADKQKADKQKADKQKPADKHADKQADAQGGKKPEAHAHHRPADERPSGPPRLQQFYREQVVARLKSDLKIDNLMQVPRISKITVNMGVGEAVADKKVMDAAVADLIKITGQKPLITKSRKAIASFKIRAGLAVGAKVTLRAFDGQGNYSLGVKEQIIFPEIQYDQIDQVRGMDITITTTARDDRHGRALLEAFNFPFRK